MPLYPEQWGPYGWKFMHMIALAYPIAPLDEDKQNYYNFFTSLGNVLPCQMCINHYKENLIKYPLTDNVLSTRDNLLKWTIDLHNEVNKSNNKYIYDYDTAIALIRNNYEDKTIVKSSVIPNPIVNNPINEPVVNEKKDNKLLYILIFLFITLIIISLLYKKY